MAARKAEVIITCDGAQAKQVLEGINRELQKAIKEREQLLNKQKQNGTLTQDEIKRDRELKKYIDSLTTAQQKSAQEMKKYTDVMKDLAGSKTKDLKKALGEVKRALDNMSSRDPKRAQLEQDLKRIQKQIDANTVSLGKNKNAWGALGTTMKNLFAYAGIFAGFNMLKSKFEEVIQKNRELSDQLANIRKVSGLAMTDVNKLATNLAKIDTRTSIQGLNELAYVGSKLGFGNYGIEGLESFTKSALKVENALKEDLGEDSMMAISKLVEVMGLIPKMGVEKAMDSAGSAIFKLASTSTATGTDIIEFSKRLMGLANVSHITTSELLALGSASSSMALMPEVSATAFNKVFTSIQSNTRAIEQSLQMQKGELTELINQGKTMEAIVTVFDKMHGMNMDELKAKGVFKALGSDGARLNNVMITMSDRIDILKTHLKTSNQAFSEGTAVAQEYAIQMETAEAYMQRAANMWTKAFVNPEGVDLTKEFAKAWYDLSKSLTQTEGNATAIKIIMESIFGIMKLLVELLPAIITGFATWGAWAGSAFLIKQLKELLTMLTAIGTGVRSISWAGLAGVITGVAMGTYILFQRFRELNGELQKMRPYMQGFKKDLSDLNTQFGAATQELDRYKRAINSTVSGTKQRAAAIAEFNNKFGGYLKNMLTEESSAYAIAKAYEAVTKALRAKMALQLKEKDISEQVMPREQWTAERREEYAKSVQGTKYSQYGRDWITTFAEENKDRSLGDIGKDLAEIFGITAKEVANMIPNLTKDQSMFKNLYNDQQWMVRNALRYIAQDRSARNAKIKVDQKWAPEQKAMDDYLASQAPKESPITPIDGDRLTKEELAAQRKEEAEYKQALRKELQDAQRDSDAIMSKIEEWYRLQETVITGFAADGKWTQKQADIMIDQLDMAKNRALADARRGISGRDEKSWEVTKKEIGQLMFDTSDMSQHLLDDILKVKLENVRTALGNIDKAGVEGISSTAMRDRLNKNAAGNDREVQRILKKSAAEVEKMLKQYDFLQQALDAFDNRLTQMGLLTESAAAAARRIQQAENGNPVEALKPGYKAPATEAEVQQQRRKGIETAATKFIQGGAQSMSVNYEDSVELDSWLRELTETTVSMGAKGQEFHFASWAEAFKEDFDKWLRNSKEYKSEIQAFFLSLVQMNDDYYDATKKAYEREKKLQDQRFRVAGLKDSEERTDTSLELQGKMQEAMGTGQNFWQQNGLADTIQSDPEILRIENRIKYRNLEYADAKAHLDRMIGLQQQELQAAKDKGASEEQIASMLEQQRQARAGLEELTYQRQTELLSATADLAAKVSQEVAERAAKIQELSQPVADFAENAGQKLGDMIFNMESQSMTWNQIWKSMVLALAQSTVKMGAQWLTQKIQQALFYKQMEADEALHQSIMTMIAVGGATARMEGEAAINATSLATNASINSAKVGQEVSMATILTMLGISEGAAKIIGTLGWWGIPLIAVISSLLLGLLASALSTAGQESAATSGGAANRKIKLASGMLTYDSGNLQEVAGEGRSTSGRLLPTGRKNVQTVVGDDGRVYRAREQQSLPSGVSIVSEPIATRVNGQQALVGERGPEIVIGRRTTRAIQMNRPDLLRDLMLIDRGITTRKVRTFDEGNLSDLASALQPAADQPQQQGQQQTLDQATIESLRMLPAAMRSFSQVMAAIQQQGIQAEVQMFDTKGRKGLRSQLQQADKMMSRYEGK